MALKKGLNIMGQVERSGVIPPIPNQGFSNGSPGSCGPTGRSASPVNPPNAKIHNGDAKNSFSPLGKQASPVEGSNEKLKFNVANAQMPQVPSAMQPGQGAVPVNPFMSGNGVTGPALKIPDSALKMPKGR